MAAAEGHTVIVELLIRVLFTLTSVTCELGWSRITLQHCRFQNFSHLRCSSEACVLFLQSGADINAKDMLKMTALHWAAQHGHHGVAETLIKHGADVHALSKFEKTPFDIAVDIQNTELMLLLQVGTPVLAWLLRLRTLHPH